MSAVQDWINNGVKLLNLGHFESAAVMRFINDAINQRPIDTTDAGQAAVLLNALIQGIHEGEEIAPAFRGLLKVRKRRNNKFDPGSAYIDSTAFDIVLQLEQKRISEKEAIEAFSAYVVGADGVEGKTIMAWIEAIRPRARQMAELIATWENK